MTEAACLPDSQVVTKKQLEKMPLVQLREFANSVGIGYVELDRKELLEKIIFEGEPVE